MRLQVHALYDTKVKAYLQPFYSRTRGEAVRQFTDLVSDPQSTVRKYAADYILFYLGDYEDSEGVFYCAQPAPERVIDGLSLREDPFTPETQIK